MLGICWLAKWGQAEEALRSRVKEWGASKQGCIRAGPSASDFFLFGFGFFKCKLLCQVGHLATLVPLMSHLEPPAFLRE